METVQIAAGLLEVLDPLLRLLRSSAPAIMLLLPRPKSHLANHHVAVESAFAEGCLGPVDMRSNLRDHWCPERYVRHKVSVHNVNMQPICSLAYGVRAFFPESAKVCTQDRGRYDSRRRHGDEVLWCTKAKVSTRPKIACQSWTSCERFQCSGVQCERLGTARRSPTLVLVRSPYVINLTSRVRLYPSSQAHALCLPPP